MGHIPKQSQLETDLFNHHISYKNIFFSKVDLVVNLNQFFHFKFRMGSFSDNYSVWENFQ